MNVETQDYDVSSNLRGRIWRTLYQGLTAALVHTDKSGLSIAVCMLGLTVCFCVPVNASTPNANPFMIYLSPDGSDANGGLSRSDPILSLSRAQDILVEADPNMDVEVHIAPGTYYGQQVEWRFTMPDHTVTFMPLDNTKIRPVFDGCPGPDAEPSQCTGDTWFTLHAFDGEATNIKFNYVRVTRYGTAISFHGNRNDSLASNGGNTVYGSYFKDIGNGFNTDLPPSTAAIRFVNSDDNLVQNNHFVNVVNIGKGAGLIHALYIAHQSSGNDISRNQFFNISGDAIRLRDASNDNRIVGNTISKAGTTGYSDWYCDHDERTDCTKRAPECPSWENAFRDNTLDGTFQCRDMKTFVYFQDDVTTGCMPPAEGAKRLRTSGNVETDAPCSSQ